MSELRKEPGGNQAHCVVPFPLLKDDETVGFDQFREFCGSLAEDLRAAGKPS